jgi:zinc transport system permease protein
MIDLTALYELIGRCVPLDCMQLRFMQRAMVALLMLAPMCAAMGVQVVNFRMAFFSDAISHSAFAGVAIGLILGLDARWTMAALAVLIGLGIVAVARRSSLSTDAIIGVFFSATVAFGLAVVSRERHVARDVQRFLYGDILTLEDLDIAVLAGLGVVLALFQIVGYNRLLYVGLSRALASAHRVRVRAYQYAFAALLAMVVILAVGAVGVLLVTAMLIVPAAAARNLARRAGGMFWWAMLVALTSAVAGLVISAQSWARTATGATIVLVASLWFAASALPVALRRRRAA